MFKFMVNSYIFFVTITRIYSIDAVSVNDIQEIISFTNTVTSSSLEVLNSSHDVNTKLQSIIDQMNKVRQQISTLTIPQDDLVSAQTMSLHNIPLEGDFGDALKAFESNIDLIDDLYQKFISYLEDSSNFDFDKAKDDFISKITYFEAVNLPSNLDNMHRIFVSIDGDPSLQDKLINQINESEDQDLENLVDVSLNELLFLINKVMVITEIRGFVVTVMAYELLNAYENQNVTIEINEASAQLVLRSEEYLLATSDAIQRNLLVVPTDPPEHIRGVTYEELENFIQEIVIDEREGFEENNCRNSCEDIDRENGTVRHSETLYTPEKPCFGKLYQCGKIGSVKLCEFSSEDESPRRYQWIESNDLFFGPKSNCSGTEKHVDDSRLRLSKCDICTCTCIQDSIVFNNAIRAVSLVPQQSDVSENKVVTGIRFLQQDNIIHVQIKQGKLLGLNAIETASNEWVPIENTPYFTEKLYNSSIDNNPHSNVNQNYSVLWNKQKSINLDDISAPIDTVITGVKFSHELPDKVDHHGRYLSPLQIEVQVTPYDYETGQLNPNDGDMSYWILPKDAIEPSDDYSRDRKELTLPGLDNPTKYRINNLDSTPNTFVSFQASEMQKDASQTTIPLIDIQKVESKIPSSINQIGLIHRGYEGSGGFLSFKIGTSDGSNNIKTTITDDQLNKYKENYEQPLVYDPPRE
ncbi:uncharacterized protein LOC130672194 [Microplitis mediator]|uniref:uncharacterized protein LOC130672194 n=1 Tax=Microplitis mediator TaxID=375433 RepID=UPI0025565A4B|nr:uncharacterized protein LOC130672194 [Microplitis mediator]